MLCEKHNAATELVEEKTNNHITVVASLAGVLLYIYTSSHFKKNSNSAMLWPDKNPVVQPFEDVFPTSCIKYGQSFQV